MKIIQGLSFLLVLSYCASGNYIKGQENYVIGTSNLVMGNQNRQVTHNVQVHGNSNNLVGANYRLNGNNIKMYGTNANIPIDYKINNPNPNQSQVITQSFGIQRENKPIDQVRGIIPGLLQNNPQITKRLQLLANFAEFVNLFIEVKNTAVPLILKDNAQVNNIPQNKINESKIEQQKVLQKEQPKIVENIQYKQKINEAN